MGSMKRPDEQFHVHDGVSVPTVVLYVKESAQSPAKWQVAYLVDMAKADALDLLGENRQALELMDRHV